MFWTQVSKLWRNSEKPIIKLLAVSIWKKTINSKHQTWAAVDFLFSKDSMEILSWPSELQTHLMALAFSPVVF